MAKINFPCKNLQCAHGTLYTCTGYMYLTTYKSHVTYRTHSKSLYVHVYTHVHVQCTAVCLTIVQRNL